MQHKLRSSQVTIHDPRAAAVFTQSHLRRVLLLFARQPRSVADVARELAVDVKQLHHAVVKLTRLRLIEVVEERPRAGRSIKFYQCAGTSFFIPAAAAPAPFSRGLAKELQEAIARDSATTVDGMVFSLDERGRVAGQVIEKRGAAPAPLDSWRILRLTTAQAKMLKHELGRVLDRFQEIADDGGDVYLVHTGMARRSGHFGITDNPTATSE